MGERESRERSLVRPPMIEREGKREGGTGREGREREGQGGRVERVTAANSSSKKYVCVYYHFFPCPRNLMCGVINLLDDPGALFLFLKPNLTYITITSIRIVRRNGSLIDNTPVLFTYTGNLFGEFVSAKVAYRK